VYRDAEHEGLAELPGVEADRIDRLGQGFGFRV